jgi:hypothetical protein
MDLITEFEGTEGVTRENFNKRIQEANEHISDTNNPHGTTAEQVGAINPNLLINGDFQVWQRGTSFSSQDFMQYTADRWFIVSTDGNSTTTVTKVDNGLKVTQSLLETGCVALYRMEEKDLKNIRGKTVTLSYGRL